MPDTISQDSNSVRIDLVGAQDIHPEATVRLVRNGQPDILAGDLDWTDFHLVSSAVDPRGAAAGEWSIVVENPDGQTAVVASALFIEGDATATPPELPRAVALSQNFPNPFNPRTTIRFELPRSGELRLEVFDLRGRRVRTLARGPRSAGYHEVVWDGTDARGAPVASGVYLYELEVDGLRLRKKMLLLE
jgi:hypothetical protein